MGAMSSTGRAGIARVEGEVVIAVAGRGGVRRRRRRAPRAELLNTRMSRVYLLTPEPIVLVPIRSRDDDDAPRVRHNGSSSPPSSGCLALSV